MPQHKLSVVATGQRKFTGQRANLRVAHKTAEAEPDCIIVGLEDYDAAQRAGLVPFGFVMIMKTTLMDIEREFGEIQAQEFFKGVVWIFDKKMTIIILQDPVRQIAQLGTELEKIGYPAITVELPIESFKELTRQYLGVVTYEVKLTIRP